MLRLLKSPLRFPIPERPASQLLERYRDLVIARVAARCILVRAHRMRGVLAAHTANVVAAEAAVRDFHVAHPIVELCATAGAGGAGLSQPETAAATSKTAIGIGYLDIGFPFRWDDCPRFPAGWPEKRGVA